MYLASDSLGGGFSFNKMACASEMATILDAIQGILGFGYGEGHSEAYLAKNVDLILTPFGLDFSQ